MYVYVNVRVVYIKIHMNTHEIMLDINSQLEVIKFYTYLFLFFISWWKQAFTIKTLDVILKALPHDQCQPYISSIIALYEKTKKYPELKQNHNNTKQQNSRLHVLKRGGPVILQLPI